MVKCVNVNTKNIVIIIIIASRDTRAQLNSQLVNKTTLHYNIQLS